MRTKHGAFISSKATRTWQKNSAPYWEAATPIFLEQLATLNPPYKISFKFVRGTKHKFDYINPLQTVQDEMVKYGWIEDDNADIIIPVFEPFEYSKEKPGVYITILKER